MKAYYSTREDAELASIGWTNLEGAAGQFTVFLDFVRQLDPKMFGIPSGTIRIARGTLDDQVTVSLDELDGRLRDDDEPLDAKLDLQPTVASREIELFELFEEDERSLGMVALRPVERGWAVVGRPPGTEDEALLFVEFGFDTPGPNTGLRCWFRSKTDLWLAYGLDGEPTAPDVHANRTLMCDALAELAARTRGRLDLRELARAR